MISGKFWVAVIALILDFISGKIIFIRTLYHIMVSDS